jgi:hypothetical protein
MTSDQDTPEKPQGPDDKARTEEAKRVVDEYASALREILRRLRRWAD